MLDGANAIDMNKIPTGGNESVGRVLNDVSANDVSEDLTHLGNIVKDKAAEAKMPLPGATSVMESNDTPEEKAMGTLLRELTGRTNYGVH
ncbi:hypothetical protein ACFL4F_02715 [Candidatus Margulisiibacteriota bacterium]